MPETFKRAVPGENVAGVSLLELVKTGYTFGFEVVLTNI